MEKSCGGHFESFIVLMRVKLQMKFNLVWRSLYLSVMLDVSFTTSSHLFYFYYKVWEKFLWEIRGKMMKMLSIHQRKCVCLFIPLYSSTDVLPLPFMTQQSVLYNFCLMIFPSSAYFGVFSHVFLKLLFICFLRKNGPSSRPLCVKNCFPVKTKQETFWKLIWVHCVCLYQINLEVQIFNEIMKIVQQKKTAWEKRERDEAHQPFV